MDLEQLTKTQIILLTLLVSFVSAIATSIFTVRLVEEAPPAVTQTINRVVERTVERVVPVEVENGSTETTIVEKETTVVVKEEDLITESIDKNKQKIVRLLTIVETDPVIDPLSTSTPEVTTSYVFQGIGVIVSGNGLVATAPQLADIAGLVAITPDGVEHQTSLVTSNGNVAVLQVEPVSDDQPVSLSPAVFVDATTLKLGQTVISIGGEDRTSVSMGIIASLIDGESGLASVQTNVTGSIPGRPIVNIFGEVVGVDLESTPGRYTSSAVIQSAIAPLITPTDSTETTEAETDTEES